MYRKAYLDALNSRSIDLGENKLVESKFCVNNYLYSQISVSALASRKFNSVKARRRIELLPSTTTDDSDYPISPRPIDSAIASTISKSSNRRGRESFKWHRHYSTEQ